MWHAQQVACDWLTGLWIAGSALVGGLCLVRLLLHQGRQPCNDVLCISCIEWMCHACTQLPPAKVMPFRRCYKSHRTHPLHTLTTTPTKKQIPAITKRNAGSDSINIVFNYVIPIGWLAVMLLISTFWKIHVRPGYGSSAPRVANVTATATATTAAAPAAAAAAAPATQDGGADTNLDDVRAPSMTSSQGGGDGEARLGLTGVAGQGPKDASATMAPVAEAQGEDSPHHAVHMMAAADAAAGGSPRSVRSARSVSVAGVLPLTATPSSVTASTPSPLQQQQLLPRAASMQGQPSVYNKSMAVEAVAVPLTARYAPSASDPLGPGPLARGPGSTHMPMAVTLMRA